MVWDRTGCGDVGLNSGKPIADRLSPQRNASAKLDGQRFASMAIANVLSRDIKAVERQVSNIYAKLSLGDEGERPQGGPGLGLLEVDGHAARGVSQSAPSAAAGSV